MRVVLVPVLKDNYSYLIINGEGEAAAVDPAEPDKASQVLWAAVQNRTRLTMVLTTHRRGQGEGAEGRKAGDTLFVGGAGRCFQGTPAQMHASLGVLARLPPEALVYCGHDYALPNLEWAATIDSGNPAVLRKLEWARAQRAAGKPSVPSTIGGELLHNLFLRCGEPELQARGAEKERTWRGSVLAGLPPAPDACRKRAWTSDCHQRCLSQALPGAKPGPRGRPPLTTLQAALGVPEGDAVGALAELRRRKDRSSWGASLVTAATPLARWLGMV
eukprot:scaffold11.g4033.t1